MKLPCHRSANPVVPEAVAARVDQVEAPEALVADLEVVLLADREAPVVKVAAPRVVQAVDLAGPEVLVVRAAPVDSRCQSL